MSQNFNYNDISFADYHIMRYRVPAFDDLSARKRIFVYHLAEAALLGRDIIYDQNGRYNLRIRRTLEAVYEHGRGTDESEDFSAMTTYLRCVWFANGIHHHSSMTKFRPKFAEPWFRHAVLALPPSALPVGTPDEAAVTALLDEICPVMFRPELFAKRVNLDDGADLLLTSACNYYRGVTQAEAVAYYNKEKAADGPRPVMHGMNSRLTKAADGTLRERRWTTGALYGTALIRIVAELEAARPYAETDRQRRLLELLCTFYRTGDLATFDRYSALWTEETSARTDFVNGFIECYGDPLGFKCSWESIVHLRDEKATERTRLLCQSAQWFEDHSPVDPRFRKPVVRGVSATVVQAAALAGDLAPSTAIGINLPNSDWVRREHGSKSVTIGNITEAYNHSSDLSSLMIEFGPSWVEQVLVCRYLPVTSDLHTDLHECLGHGSGQLLPGTDPDALRNYGSTIEEARADLFALYYIGDAKMQELGLLPDALAVQGCYYEYVMNGALTQLRRVTLGGQIEEAHMRNRALIARWCLDHGHDAGVLELGRGPRGTALFVHDYDALRTLFARLLAEIQRIKSEGDYEAARTLVETYGVHVDPELHREVVTRVARCCTSTYKGFLNPRYTPERDSSGQITDVRISYDETFDDQMLRYSHDYATLPHVND